ncbi:MAG: hypothetical protein QMC67_07285 [Candidatus Wallbacteria bacterium]
MLFNFYRYHFKNFLVIVFVVALFIQLFAGQSKAAVHFIHQDGLFNFTLLDKNWYESPLSDKFFFNLVPDATLFLDNDSNNVMLSIARLPVDVYTDDLQKAYDIIYDKISKDTNNIIVLKQNYAYNDINFKDIIYKDKIDLSNVRVIFARDSKKTPAVINNVFMILFYYPKKSDFLDAESEVMSLLKTFKTGTEIAEPVNENFLGKTGDTIGEAVAVYESKSGTVTFSSGDKNFPAAGTLLFKIGQNAETRSGMAALKLTDNTLLWLNKNTRTEFMTMANIKLAMGELMLKTQQLNGDTFLRIGNYIKCDMKSARVLFSYNTSAGSSFNTADITVLEGECLVSGDGEAKASLASQKLTAGQNMRIEINEMGKLKQPASVTAANINDIAAKSNEWTKLITTHKIYDTISLMEKLKKY